MDRRGKLELLQGIMDGTTTPAQLRQQTVKFILPCNGREIDGKDWLVFTQYNRRTYTHTEFLNLKISRYMNREEIIKRLEAIQSGGIAAIARPLPRVWAKRYGKDELINEVKKIYGPDAKVIKREGKLMVISDKWACWHFFDTEDDRIECNGQFFTREEYESIVSELCKEQTGNTWIETKTQDRMIHWVRQKGNEPLEAEWDWTGAGDTQPKEATVTPAPDPPKQTVSVKPVITVQHEVEDLHEVKEPEPEEQETIRLSTWEPKRSADETRREKMNQWQKLNGNAL